MHTGLYTHTLAYTHTHTSLYTHTHTSLYTHTSRLRGQGNCLNSDLRETLTPT